MNKHLQPAPAEERETPDEMVVTDSVRIADGGDIRVVCRGEVARMAFHAGFKAGHEAAQQVAAQSCSYSEEYYWMRSQPALPAEDRAVTPPRDLTRLRQAVFGGDDRPSWTIEQVIALAQAHRQDSQLMDAKQDTEDRAVTAPQEQNMTLLGATTPTSPARNIDWEDWKLGYLAGQRDAMKEKHVELVEALKSEGQKDEWIEMLSASLRAIVVAVSGNDDWEGSVADGIDVLNLKFKEVNAVLEKQHEQVAALTHAIEVLRGQWRDDAERLEHRRGQMTREKRGHEVLGACADALAAILKEWEGRHA